MKDFTKQNLYKIKYYYHIQMNKGPLRPSVFMRNIFVFAADVTVACEIAKLRAQEYLALIASKEMMQCPPEIVIESVEFIIAAADIAVAEEAGD